MSGFGTVRTEGPPAHLVITPTATNRIRVSIEGKQDMELTIDDGGLRIMAFGGYVSVRPENCHVVVVTPEVT